MKIEIPSKKNHFESLNAEGLGLLDVICGPCIFGSNVITPLPQDGKRTSYVLTGNLRDFVEKVKSYGECDRHHSQALETKSTLRIQYGESIHDAVNEMINSGVETFTSVQLTRFMKQREMFLKSYPQNKILVYSISSILGSSYEKWGLSRNSNVTPCLYFKNKK